MTKTSDKLNKQWWNADSPHIKYHDEANEWIDDAKEQMDSMYTRIRELESFILFFESANCSQNRCMTAVKGKETQWNHIINLIEKHVGILEDERFIIPKKRKDAEKENEHR